MAARSGLWLHLASRLRRRGDVASFGIIEPEPLVLVVRVSMTTWPDAAIIDAIDADRVDRQTVLIALPVQGTARVRVVGKGRKVGRNQLGGRIGPAALV